MALNVLLIEDNPADARLVRIMLQSAPEPYILETAESLSAGIRRLEEEQFDGILLDLFLPDSEGTEAIRTIHGRFSLIPVVILTGVDDHELGVRLMREGAEDYLCKNNLSEQSLVRAIRYAIERHGIRQQLQSSQANYRDLFENANDIIYSTDLTGNVTSLNKAGEKLIGAPREQVIGKNVGEFFGPGAARLIDVLQERSPDGISHSWQSTFLQKNGSSVTLAISARLIHDKGEPLGLQGIARDVTERTQLENALRQSEGNFRSLFEDCPFGILCSKPNGDVLQVNPAAVKMLGYGSERDILNLNMARDIYCDPTQRSSFLDDVRKQNRGMNMECEWKRKDGSTFKVRIAKHAVLNSAGEIERLQSFIEDVTEKHILEKQHRQWQKLEAIGRLSGGIAHDFNNILGVILGYAELMQQQYDSGSAGQRMAGEILKAGNRGAALTRQLLAFSRQQVLEPKVLNMNEIFADMDKFLRRLIGEDIRFSVDLNPTLGNVKADRSQLEQVILNLAVNAREAMPSGGQLTVTTANVRLDSGNPFKGYTVRPGDYVHLSIRDTGSGMDSETKAKVFEPFFTTKDKGTGLGLATVYGIVKQSNGYIEITSAAGAGATFDIYLPRVQDALSNDPIDLPLSKSHIRGTTVLLVEDEESLRRLTRESLQALGFDVLAARDGTEALKICFEHSGAINLLLTDIVMPGLGGHQLAKEFAKHRPEIRVLFMSGYTGQMPGRNTSLPDGSVFLQKPFTQSTLLHKLREALNTF